MVVYYAMETDIHPSGWYFRMDTKTSVGKKVGPFRTRALARDAQFKAKCGVPVQELVV